MQAILYAMLVAIMIVIISGAISGMVYLSTKEATLSNGQNKIPILSSKPSNGDLEIKIVSDFMELTNSYAK